MKIADLRAELGLSLEEFASRIGLASRGRMSVIEREERCGLDVALRIELLSADAEGRPRIDAAALCDDVRAARAGLVDAGLVHAGGVSLSVAGLATGQAADLSGGREAKGEAA